MTEILGILWLRPYWLMAVPIAILIGILLWRRSGNLGAWEYAIDPSLLPYLQRRGLITQGSSRLFWLPAALLTFIAIALAGPMSERRDQPTFRNLDAVVLVVDLSPSMTSDPRFEDTLTTARLIASAATQAARPVALIVYAGEAYLASPLTTDTDALGGMIALLDHETIPSAGSRPAEGLKLAHHVLQQADILFSDVVLISDGQGLGADALATALELRKHAASLSVVNTGASSPQLTELARVGDGSAGNPVDPFAVVDRIAARQAERLAETEYAVLLYRDLGRYLLILAMIPALALLPRGRPV